MARAEPVIPGIPRQGPSSRALQAAREASRASSPEVQDIRIEALGHRVETLEGRVEDMADGQNRVERAVDALVAEVGEWKLEAVDSEGVKIREEQKTKRWMAMIGLLTILAAPTATAIVNYMTKDTTPPRTEVIHSSMQKEMEDICTKAPSDDAWLKCIADTAARNAPVRQR